MIRTGRSRYVAALMAAAMGVAAAFSSSLNASASSVTTVPFTAVFYGCGSVDPTVNVSGDKILHFRDAVNFNYWVASTPLMTGPEFNTVNGNINLDTGFGVAHPHEVLTPVGYDGTWEFSVRIKVTPDGLLADAVGHGTGVFRGMLLKWTQTGSMEIGPGENPCGDLPFAATIAGEIQMPASAG